MVTATMVKNKHNRDNFFTEDEGCAKFFFSILQIYKDSQFNNKKIKKSKIQVQNKTQTLRKPYTFLNKVSTSTRGINVNNNNNNNDDDNNNNKNSNNNNNNHKLYRKKLKVRKEREKKNYKHIFEA